MQKEATNLKNIIKYARMAEHITVPQQMTNLSKFKDSLASIQNQLSSLQLQQNTQLAAISHNRTRSRTPPPRVHFAEQFGPVNNRYGFNSFQSNPSQQMQRQSWRQSHPQRMEDRGRSNSNDRRSYSDDRRQRSPHRRQLNKPCPRCGKFDHFHYQCPFKNAICHVCDKSGHISSNCFSARPSPHTPRP